jgi:hypothetical protein
MAFFYLHWHLTGVPGGPFGFRAQLYGVHWSCQGCRAPWGPAVSSQFGRFLNDYTYSIILLYLSIYIHTTHPYPYPYIYIHIYIYPYIYILYYIYILNIL